MATIEVLNSGFAATVQDLGRYQYQSAGFPVSGAMDQASLKLANLLVNNDANAAALEFILAGPTLQFQAPTFIAITGAASSPSLNGQPIALNQAIAIQAGDQVQFAPMATGRYGYLAVANGGLQVPMVLGSRATTLKIQLGGLFGRTLAVGDALPFEPCYVLPSLAHRHAPVPAVKAPGHIRVLKGPQWDLFTPAAQSQFLQQTYQISQQADRMGYQLQGEPLPVPTENLISEGTVLGNIQITRNGQPIVLLADRQTAGGYPMIATVIGADLASFVQMSAGEDFQFELTALNTARALLAAQQQVLTTLAASFAAQKYQAPVGPARTGAQKLAQIITHRG
ncbi:allophanate hydrolase 2 subunit 2 [Agrilactobacillus composti DSM 18527 = JCM 14202]|uniref:5-oxoprolinase subunit C family protein n=1 Tax=Agrilactobacillus composti TaxID=398555 RepID=UPI00042DE6C4|nr:biotin-dependent carboxyltransferase family protein [Agrilactobacillus composti]GAF41327.1 allophanate hydrolase 2 subunit 2 [Agrilactobacillus composti DSM 18527 = JCM 14202]